MPNATERLLTVTRGIAQTRVFPALLRRLPVGTLAVRQTQGISAKEFANIGIPAEVIAYFPDDVTRAYQLEQWLPVFEQLEKRHSVLVLTRSLGMFRHLQNRTRLPLIYVRRLADLEEVLERADPKVCLYVNNASSNFQVLSWRRALHVHLNHGESDKISMASNQAKAYDVVLVAGEAAEVRYKDNLLGFDGANLVRVGRPQLDLEFAPVLPPSNRPTVIYAPTWEGETAAMDYSSMPKYGPRLVRDLVADGRFRVVYKPHPRIVVGSQRVVRAHEEITRRLRAASAELPENEQHVIELNKSILALFASCDAMVCDVSSVAVDWLYLRPGAPLWICDPREDRDALVQASPLAARAYVLDRPALPDFVAQLRESVETDPRRAEREEARRFYFGDLAPGDSMQRFLGTIDAVAARRDALLADKKTTLRGLAAAAA